MDYEDFVVAITPEEEGRLRVRVEESPAGKAEERVDLPRLLIASGLRFGRRWRHVLLSPNVPVSSLSEPGELEEPERLGQELYRAAFTGDVARLLAESFGMARRASRGLRIKLRLDLTDSRTAGLHGLPWETIHLGERRGFLNLRRSASLVRDLTVSHPERSSVFVLRLRILVVLCAPRGLPPLDLDRERREIRAAWGRSFRVAVTFLQHPSIEKLREVLLGGRFHAVHFMGHGGFDPGLSAGALYFEGEGGGAQPVTGPELAGHFADVESLRLVVLNACETAVDDAGTPGANPFSGVATALVQGGVAAVVAMQLPISDAAAIAFSRVFYRRLAAGDPIDCAVAESRLAVHQAFPDTWEWAVPVLFLRSGDSRILVRLWRWLVLGLSLLFLGTAAVVVLVSRPVPQPTRLVLEENAIQIFDAANRPMWTRQVRGSVRKGLLEDLDGDGESEVVIGVAGKEEDSGKIFVFDRGGEVRWSVDTHAKVPFPGGGRSGSMSVRELAVGDLFDSGRRQVVSISLDAEGWYPSRLAVWSSDGKLLGDYWHAGHLQFIRLGRRREGAPLRIVTAGVANDLTHFFEGSGYPRAVLLLDPRRVEGQGPPYLGTVGKGSHLWYKAILPKEEEILRLEITDRDRDGEREIMTWVENGNVLYFDFEGRLVSRGRSDGATGSVQVFDIR